MSIALSYMVEPIDVIKRHKLIEKYTDRVLFENKGDIYGCWIKPLIDSEDTKNMWQDKFYFASQDFFTKYLNGVSTFLVNTIRLPLETHARMADKASRK